MKPAVRHILTFCAGALIAVLYLVVFTAERSRAHMQSCQGLKVAITDSASLGFVSEADIAGYMEEYGPYIGQLAEAVDLQKIEEILSRKSAILRSEAYMDRDGFIHIDIVQREPVVRFQTEETGFYADEKGYLFPLQKGYTNQVPLISGAIPLTVKENYRGKPGTEAEELWVERIIALVQRLERNRWSDRFSEINVLRSGDIILIPTEGKERFLLGSPTAIGGKLSRIATYYASIAPAHDPGYYRTVDVRYDKQIICKKQ